MTRIQHSFVWILLITVVMLAASVTTAYAATLSVSPGTGVYIAGQTFTTRVIVNTQGSPINAAEATLSFNPTQLSVVGISKGSIFNLWTVEPSYSNSAGTITFGGGSPAGYTGGAGTILNITFRSNAAGTARVNFSNGSILAADGRGTNVAQSLNGGNYTITSAATTPEPEVVEYVAPANTPGSPQIVSETHAHDGWSQETTATLTWNVPGDVTGVRTLLDDSPTSIPTKVYDTPIESITLDELEEGIQYFHLQFRNADGWGAVAHYRLAVDFTAPTDIAIAPAEDVSNIDPVQKLQISVTDELSEVRRFMVRVDAQEPFEYIDETGSSTITLPRLEPGYHTVVIEAYDEAGNSTIGTYSFTIESFEAPSFTEFPDSVSDKVIPVIKGTTRPQALVRVTFRSVSRGNQEQYETTADESGAFTIIPDNRFTNGVYEVVAIAEDTNGAQSEPSAPSRMLVETPGYIAIGSLVLSVMSIVVPLLALLFILILLGVYFVAKLRKLRSSVHIETAEAIAILQREFTGLTKALATHEQALKKSRKAKKLTKAEAALLEDVRSNLVASENLIIKEISDVDEVVG